jgi:plasmid stabilization system protein ParE
MKFSIIVTATAKREADEAFVWLRERTEVYAIEWFNGLVDAVEELSEFPSRWPIAREPEIHGQKIRQMLYGRRPHIYRVLFLIRDNVVYVLHIRHGARRALRLDEIEWP